MEDWKVRQEVYHRLNKEHGDNLSDKKIALVAGNDIIIQACRYFEEDIGWVYPSKSFVVAICYAKWLSKEFAVNFYTALDDSELLYNNDPHFVPYTYSKLSKEIYDAIISSVGLGFDESKGVIPDIRKYFEQEFMLND